MASNRPFFDANLIIEIVLERQRKDEVVRLTKQINSPIFISTLTSHLTVHFGQQHATITQIQDLLSVFDTIALTPDDVAWAFANMRGSDFEDALQIAVAIRNGCDQFFTLDKQLASAYNNLPTLKITLLN